MKWIQGEYTMLIDHVADGTCVGKTSCPTRSSTDMDEKCISKFVHWFIVVFNELMSIDTGAEGM